MTHFRVITGALRAEAKRWDRLAEQAASPRDYARDATLPPTAFLLVDPTGIAPVLTWDRGISSILEAESYDTVRELEAKLLDGAVTEFGQIADALIKAAKAYEDAERIFPLEVRDIYTI